MTLVAALFGLAALAAPPLTYEKIDCPETVRPLRDRMKLGVVLDDFETTSLSWRTPAGSQAAQAAVQACRDEKHAGQAALRVEYKFTGRAGLEYIDLQRSVPLSDDAAGIGFWLKRGPQSLPLAVRIVDRSGEVHQFGFEEEPGDGWHFVAAALRAGSSWSGDGNQRLDKPLKLIALVFDRPKPGYQGQGLFWIDDLATFSPASSTKELQIAVDGKRFGNVYLPGETLGLHVATAAGQVRWRVKDYGGEVRAESKRPAASAEIAYTLSEPGFYRVVLERLRDASVVESRDFRCAALPPSGEPARDAFAGFCTHFGHNTYALDLMDLLKRYGFRRFRDEVSWGSVERQRDQYALPEHAVRYLDHARKLDMEPLLIFDYANSLYDKGGFPNSPEAIAAFAEYAAQLARMTSNSVREFEIWNEWIGGCGMRGKPGDHGPEAYGRLMQAAYRRVRSVRPDARIIGIGGEYGPHCAENIVRAVRTAGPQSLDAFSIHPYRYPRPPESSELVGDVQRILDQTAACGASRRTWITEIGYPTHFGREGSREQDQARRAVRTLTLLQSCAGVDKVHWYDLKDDGLTREYNEHNFGVVLNQAYNCAPKPAMVAMSVWARLTAGATATPAEVCGDVYGVRYRRGDQQIAVLWTTAGVVRAQVSGRGLVAYDLMGRRLASATAVTLSEDPLFVMGRNLQWRPQ